MKEPTLLLAILAMVATGMVLLVMLVCCMAMGANAQPSEIRSLKYWMVGLTVMSLAGIVAGLVLLRYSQPEWSAGASILPAVVMVVIALVALFK